MSETDSGSGMNETFKILRTRSKGSIASICIDDLLNWHDTNLQKYANPGYKGLLWSLLEFDQQGQLAQSWDANDYTPGSRNTKLKTLLAEPLHDLNFQILVRYVGNGAGLTEEDVRLLDTVYHLPIYFWRKLLSNHGANGGRTSNTANFEDLGVLQADTDVLQIDSNYLCFASSLGSVKYRRALLFLTDYCKWNYTWPSFSCLLSASPLLTEQVEILDGGYGLLARLISQSNLGQDASDKDYPIMCADALICSCLVHLTCQIQHEMDTQPRRGPLLDTGNWQQLNRRLLALQDTTDNMLDWLAHNHATTNQKNQLYRKARIKSYRKILVSLTRKIQAQRACHDLNFAHIAAEMASDSIQESQVSKILTLLAIVYLPVSIASSIFGMNVQELNSTGPRITWFIIAIFVVVGALLLCWVIFHLISSQRRYIIQQELEPGNLTYVGRPRPWTHRIFFIGLIRDRIHMWRHRLQDFRYRILARFQSRTTSLRSITQPAGRDDLPLGLDDSEALP